MEASRMQNTIRPIRKPKRFRSAFTTEQIKFLELQFKKFPYISSEHRTEISTALNMQERAVKIWFQNRRMKEKKESTNKELDNATAVKAEESGKDRLNNVCNLPSTNDQVSYSIPVIMKPVNSTSMFTGANTDSFHKEVREKVEIQQVPQNLSTNHIKSPINLTQDRNVYHALLTNGLPSTQIGEPSRKQFKNRNQQFNKKPVEFSLDLSKRLKKGRREINHDQKPKLQKKLGVHPPITVKSRTFEEAPSKKKTAAPSTSSKLSKQAKANGPTYFPVMPTVYAHPYISSGGVIWKPINIMPVVTPGNAVPGPSLPQQNFGHDQKMNCNCNCHGNPQPLTGPPNITSPYAQYVFTASAPYRNLSPKF